MLITSFKWNLPPGAGWFSFHCHPERKRSSPGTFQLEMAAVYQHLNSINISLSALPGRFALRAYDPGLCFSMPEDYTAFILTI
jgi:hypothetical protein